jgi:hypothetical protein
MARSLNVINKTWGADVAVKSGLQSELQL